jgi:hypothetical protein
MNPIETQLPQATYRNGTLIVPQLESETIPQLYARVQDAIAEIPGATLLSREYKTAALGNYLYCTADIPDRAPAPGETQPIEIEE